MRVSDFPFGKVMMMLGDPSIDLSSTIEKVGVFFGLSDTAADAIANSEIAKNSCSILMSQLQCRLLH